MRQFLEFIVRHLVEYPEEVMISEIPQDQLTIFRLQMRQTDVGRIIGRNGQTIRSIRALLSSAAVRHGQRVTLDIIE
ncbi:MAG: KH domain-containing protein [Chthoniobacterales bacterium]